ncbi:DNA polymerase kappa [Trypanosoma grayi]|uniref:DNA polymerase kappa n=1 Tax=Trypanosoma grayi TaxID=71804 RepID=UPI0004F4BC05|nr:DNA polymerase kappa [Trypanosoma grayi]KEG09797.1 DNA polymerase kappa [Trypanosoma grayi]
MRCRLTRLAAATLCGCTLRKARRSAATGKMQLDVSKAGLAGVNKAHVNAVIEKCTKGSAFYMNEKRMESQREKRNASLCTKSKKYRLLSASARQSLMKTVSACEAELEAGRRFGNYVHVDMDMFYAAVEMKKNPSLAEVPLGVGSVAMLSTTNYVARRYGVRSGMPGFIGRKLCPALVIVPTDFDAYRAEAAVVRGIAAEYDPHFISVGLDELTMEVSAHLQQNPGMTAADVAAEFRARVVAETQLTASAGIAPTATLSKIASNYKKPNGQHELRLRTREDVIAFMKDLPVREIPGIGPVQNSMLASLGIRTCGAIHRQKYKLCYVFPGKTFEFYLSAALGVMQSGADRMRADRAQKTVGHEVTVRRRLKNEAELKHVVLKALALAHDALLRQRKAARRITLRLKRRSFEDHQYSVTLDSATNDMTLLWRETQKLLQPHLTSFDDFRLAGVRLGKLQMVPERHLPARKGNAQIVSRFTTQPLEPGRRTGATRRIVI